MYIQTTQAAKQLGISRQWLYQLIRQEKIGTTVIGGHRVVIDDFRFQDVLRRQTKKQNRVLG